MRISDAPLGQSHGKARRGGKSPGPWVRKCEAQQPSCPSGRQWMKLSPSPSNCSPRRGPRETSRAVHWAQPSVGSSAGTDCCWLQPLLSGGVTKQRLLNMNPLHERALLLLYQRFLHFSPPGFVVFCVKILQSIFGLALRHMLFVFCW